MTLATPSAYEEEAFAAAQRLLNMLLPPQRRVRLVGVKVSKLVPVEGIQLDLVKAEKVERLHQRLDALQAKFGYSMIQWGITYALQHTYRPGDDGYELHSPVYEL